MTNPTWKIYTAHETVFTNCKSEEKARTALRTICTEVRCLKCGNKLAEVTPDSKYIIVGFC